VGGRALSLDRIRFAILTAEALSIAMQKPLRSGAAARVIALAACCLVAAVSPWPHVIGSFDKGFPARPTATDLAALREAYAHAPATWPRPRLFAEARFEEMGPLALLPRPEGADARRAQLGEKLFNDPMLSASGQIACQSCHNRNLGWGDGLPVSFGHGRAQGKRNAPSLFSAGYHSAFFWDGRAKSLEEQTLGPLGDGREMANDDFSTVLERLNGDAGYQAAFAPLTGRVTIEIADVTGMLAAFERTLERTTRFDRFAAGDEKALTDQQVWGLHLFRTKAGCANCHSGPLLSDGKFHNLGLSFIGRGREDLGRYAVTGRIEDAGAFRTPSLRHVSRTVPYMHNGIFPTLEGLVRFYEFGGGRVRGDRDPGGERKAIFDAAAKNSPLLKRLELTDAERKALVAYLEAL
jgi:cytochrome c peroxidase